MGGGKEGRREMRETKEMKETRETRETRHRGNKRGRERAVGFPTIGYGECGCAREPPSSLFHVRPRQRLRLAGGRLPKDPRSWFLVSQKQTGRANHR